MEERFKKQDRIIKNLIKDVPLEKPSIDFSKSVIQQIEKKQTIKTYQPLLSKTAWAFIIAGFILALGWVYLMPTSSNYGLEVFLISDKINLKNPFSELVISKTVMYAICFMALFLLQIPFLKRMLEKNNS